MPAATGVRVMPPFVPVAAIVTAAFPVAADVSVIPPVPLRKVVPAAPLLLPKVDTPDDEPPTKIVPVELGEMVTPPPAPEAIMLIEVDVVPKDAMVVPPVPERMVVLEVLAVLPKVVVKAPVAALPRARVVIGVLPTFTVVVADPPTFTVGELRSTTEDAPLFPRVSVEPEALVTLKLPVEVILKTWAMDVTSPGNQAEPFHLRYWFVAAEY